MMVATAGERTVFVVDDDDAARDSLVMLLKSDGLTTRGFASAHDFLAQFDTALRGCVVTDLRMPSMDGIELIRELKAVGCLLPVIVITGHADVSRAVDAMKAGATDFIEKPYEAEQLLRAVRGCIEENDAAVDANAARSRCVCLQRCGLRSAPHSRFCWRMRLASRLKSWCAQALA